MSTTTLINEASLKKETTIDLTAFYAGNGAFAFAKKPPANPSSHRSRPLTQVDNQALWNSLLDKPLNPCKRLIYTHIPFCATHCSFCGFFQNSVKKYDTEKYTQYLLKELAQQCDSPLIQSTPIHAIYLGGGTPTALTADQLRRVITFYKNNFPLAPDCEITVEGRILNFDEEKIEACLDAGANRFSIGIQTFDTKIRQRMGRCSNKEQAIAFLDKLTRYNLATIVCDLMFGLPGQTPGTWQEDLDIVQSLNLDGVDLYAINIIPNTKLAESIANQELSAPSPEEIYNYYMFGLNSLYDAGWSQLSNNHWARTTRERNLYNLLIKQGADYLAYGSGAGGRLADYAFMLERNLERYYSALDNDYKPLMMIMNNKQPDWSHVLQGQVETGLVKLSDFPDVVHVIQPLIDQWHQVGLLVDNSKNLRFTATGRFWGRSIYVALNTLFKQLIV